MGNLASWVRRLFRSSQPPERQVKAVPVPPVKAVPVTVAPLPTPLSERERRIDAAIGAAEVTVARVESLAQFAAGNNKFAVALHHQLRGHAGNLFLSPFSVRAALAMSYLGARGGTAAQMREVLCMAIPDDEFCAGYAELVSRLRGTDGAHRIAVANSLWTQLGAPVEAAFAQSIGTYFDGACNPVDFVRGAATAREAINDWVRDRTQNRIPDALPAGLPDPDTRLLIVNAIHFRGLWREPFEREHTRDEPFFLTDGTQVQVPLMHQKTSVRYRQGAGYQAVTLPYLGTELAMAVILPDQRDGLADLESGLSAAMIGDCLQTPVSTRVELSLPRFHIHWGTDELGDVLAALGMTLALGGEADFSGINGRAPPDEAALFISGVVHKAFVDVDEQGTEAAASTLLMQTVLGLSPRVAAVPVFRADHPFLFAIGDPDSGAILFLGRMVDPSLAT